jgi:hypothetical protein
MSRLAHPIAATQLRSHRAAVIAALLALLATVAVVLALTIGSGSTTTGTVAPQSAVSGPSESHIAAAVGSRVSPPPDESSIASSVASGTPKPSTGPDESHIASSLSSR